jgi:hypothetical protein
MLPTASASRIRTEPIIFEFCIFLLSAPGASYQGFIKHTSLPVIAPTNPKLYLECRGRGITTINRPLTLRNFTAQERVRGAEF